jgi:hypothetical protein
MQNGTGRQTGAERQGMRSRWAGAAAMGTLGVAVLLVLMVPASASTAAPMTVVHLVRVSAPYAGASSSPSSSTYTSGCSASTVLTLPFWHARTGAGGFSGSAAARNCAPAGGDGSSSESFTAYVPIPVLAGHDHIVATWSLDVSGGSSLALGHCSYPASAGNSTFHDCYAEASSELYGSAYLYDATNGSYVGSPTTSWAGLLNQSYYYDDCTGQTCTTYASGSGGTFAFNGTVTFAFQVHGLVATHHYELIQWFSGYESVDVGTYNAHFHHTHGTAWLNAGTFGNGISLTSVTVR